MKVLEFSPKVNTIDVYSARSNGRDYSLTLETPDGHVEVPVAERIYRRALIDFLSPQDIEELNQWLAARDVEVIELHEAEFGDWPQLPSDDKLNDLADANAQILSGIPAF